MKQPKQKKKKKKKKKKRRDVDRGGAMMAQHLFLCWQRWSIEWNRGVACSGACLNTPTTGVVHNPAHATGNWCSCVQGEEKRDCNMPLCTTQLQPHHTHTGESHSTTLPPHRSTPRTDSPSPSHTHTHHHHHHHHRHHQQSHPSRKFVFSQTIHQ